MKKYITCFLICFFLLSNVILANTIEEYREQVNQEIATKYDKENYFISENDKGKFNIIESLDKQHKYIVYGNPYGTEMDNESRNLGYTKEGGEYANPDFPWDAGWSGTMIQDFNLVKTPWENPQTMPKAPHNEFCNIDILEQNIIDGLNYHYAGKTGDEFLPSNFVNNRDKIVYIKDAIPKQGGKWIDYVYVMQPPTYNEWGTGKVWHNNGVNYFTIPIAPFNLDKNIAIMSIKNNKEVVEKGKTYQCTINLQHTFSEDLNNVDIQFFVDGAEDATNRQAVTLTKNTPTKATFTYTIPEGYPNKEITLTAKVNMIEATRIKEESDYSDNEITLKVPIIDENIDLAVTDIRYEKYPANSRVSAVVEVTNYSTVYCKDIPVFFQVTLNDNTAIKTKIIPGNLLPGATTVLTYDFNTPDANCTLKLYAEVNKDDTFVETNKSNNSKSINAQVIRNTRKLGCYPELEWTEIDKRWEVIGYDAEGNPEYGWVYYTFVYHAYMNSTATVTPQTLKSGYGFEVGVTSTVSYVQVSGEWTRTPDNPPQAPTTARVQVGWDTNIYYMQRAAVNGLTSTFILPVNPISKIGARKIYTHIDLAGTQADPQSYPVRIEVYGSSVPTGELCNTIDTYITINGDMYEDDNTY